MIRRTFKSGIQGSDQAGTYPSSFALFWWILLGSWVPQICSSYFTHKFWNVLSIIFNQTTISLFPPIVKGMSLFCIVCKFGIGKELTKKQD